MDFQKVAAIQRDHMQRCHEAAVSGVVYNSPENERLSYTDLQYMVLEHFTDSIFGRSVLDVGCQTAEAAPYLKEIGLKYQGLEVLEEVAEMAQNKFVGLITGGFMECMPYSNDTFDVVWARHVMEHTGDAEAMYSEFKRVLKPGGILAFMVPCGFYNEPAHINECTKEGWIAQIEEHGFTILETGQHPFNLDEFYGIATVTETPQPEA
jgi:SAM-dependent methyltransferase